MNQESSSTPPLLDLPDECLLDILQRLKMIDFVHCAQTCVRLHNVARLNKFEKISVHTTTDVCNVTNNMVSRREFVEMMSLIGEDVLTVHIYHGLNDVFEIIRDNCKNLNSLDLYDCQEPVQIRGLKHLKVLKLWSRKRIVALPDFNNDIVSLDVRKLIIDNCSEGRSYFLELLKRLPKLRSLHLGYVCSKFNYLDSREFLLSINGLTSLSFRSEINVNTLLKKLSSLNLVKLCFEMEFDKASFDILQRFQNLEVLVIIQHGEIILLPEATVLPLKLEYVKIDNIDISSSKFSSIVEEAECLEVFDLGSNGCILFNESGSEHFPNKEASGQENMQLITQIVKHLRNRRPLTIKFSHIAMHQRTHVSNNIQVVNNSITDKEKPKKEIVHITVIP